MTAPRVPIDEVPDWALQFLLPSRYCQSDLVFTQRRRDHRRRPARLPAGRGDPVVDRARDRATSTAPARRRRRRSTRCTAAPACAATSPTSASPCAAASTSRPAWSSATSTSSTRWTSTPGSRPTSAAAGSRSTPPSTSREGNRVTVAYGRDAADVAFVTQFGPVELRAWMSVVRPTRRPMSRPVDTGPYAGRLTSVADGPRPDITTTPPWADLLDAPRPPHLRELFAADPGRAERYLAHGRRPAHRLLQAARRRRRAGRPAGRRRRRRRRGPPRRDVRRRARSTSPRTAPCCTSRCGRRPATVDRASTATTSCPTSTRCSAGWATFAEQVRDGTWTGATGRAHPHRRQHRHRRLRPRPGDGVPGPRRLPPPRARRPASCPTSTAPTSPARSPASTRPRRCSSCRRRRSRRSRR